MRRCACGLAGTDFTPDGLCATCGRPLNAESVAWLAEDYGRLLIDHRGAVSDLAEANARIETLLAAENKAWRDAQTWKERAVESGWR